MAPTLTVWVGFLDSFVWGEEQQQSFEQIKSTLCNAPELVIPDFEKLFQVEINALAIDIGVVLTQLSSSVKNWVKLERNDHLMSKNYMQ